MSTAKADNTKKVIVVAGDPGGANALLPVLKKIPHHVVAYAYKQAFEIFSKALPDMPCQDLGAAPSVEKAAALIEEAEADIIFGAASHNKIDWEKYFYEAGKAKGIPTMAVLDLQGNAKAFFELEGQAFGQPDKIMVKDQDSLKMLMKSGIAQDAITVSGQPALDECIKLRKSNFDKEIDALKAQLETDADYIIQFASQPIKMLNENGLSNGPPYPFDEFEVFEHVHHALQGIFKDRDESFCIAVRLHPREDPELWQAIFNNNDAIYNTTELDKIFSAQSSHLITGIVSMYMTEAACLGKNVISIFPESEDREVLSTNLSGATEAVYQLDALENTLSAFLFDEERQKAQLRIQEETLSLSEASDCILEELEKLLASA